MGRGFTGEVGACQGEGLPKQKLFLGGHDTCQEEDRPAARGSGDHSLGGVVQSAMPLALGQGPKLLLCVLPQ